MYSESYSQPPLVNRRREIALLDDVLQAVRDGASPSVVWLYGEGGCGKSALAEAFVERVGEQARVFYGEFGYSTASDHRLGQMLAEHFGCPRTSWEAAFHHVDQLYDRLGVDRFEARYDVLGLTDMIAASAACEPERARCGFESPRLKNAALERLFRRLAQTGPVLLWLDDADESLEALSLLRHLLDIDGPHFPLMAVATARAATSTSGQTRRERFIDDILDHPFTTRLEVGPLSNADQFELIERLAPLAPELTRRLVRHTGGNPLFAIELITTWYERDLLEPCGGRLMLDDSGADSFPSNVYQVWHRRLERALADGARQRVVDARRALQLAAAIGPLVDADLWRAVCEEAELAPPDGLLASLIDHDLATETRDGWRFAHGLLHHTVVKLARTSGYWEEANLVCAHALSRLDATHHARRIADHLLEADRPEEALEPLYTAGRLACDRGRYEEASRCFDRHTEWLRSLAIPDEDRRRAQNAVGRAFVALQTGQPDLVDELGPAALEQAETHGWIEEAGWAALLLGRRASSRGRRPESLEYLQTARGYFEQIDNTRGVANALASLGYAHYAMGEVGRARRHFERAYRHFDRIGARAMMGRVCHTVALVDMFEEKWAEAAETTEKALALARQSGDRVIEAGCWANFGEIAFEQGDWERARTSYQKALRLHRLVSNRNEYNARYNLARVDLAEGEVDEAQRKLEALLERLPEVGLKTYLGTVYAALARCAALREEYERVDRYLERAAERFEELEQAFPDEASMAEHAGEALVDQGQIARARRALSLAAERYEALGRRKRAERLEVRVDAWSDQT